VNIDLDDLDHRAIGEALVERVGCLIEIVEDTTRTMSARRTASRELSFLVSALPPLHRMTITSELGGHARLQRSARRSRAS
jgi:hypothetical protein